ncbi:MAG: DNA double-strand break repair nuclease NurA [Anaerolineales bacterium]|nr:DNA double-strand break repair nuclease NurA [Anaerolineales bacterium]
MFHAGKMLAALEAKRAGFTEAEATSKEDLDALNLVLIQLAKLSAAEIEAKLPNSRAGAHPTLEYDAYPSLIVPFKCRWQNHRQAREWAAEILTGITTIAADGSQITPSRDLSIPVGVVQVGWFENQHILQGGYVKNVQVEVLTPAELIGLDVEDEDPATFPDWRINLRRFVLEIERLITFMEAHRETEPKPLAFFDGSFIISFAQHMQPNRQKQYSDAVLRLLNTSEQTKVPVIGYVDTSYATDLVEMLRYSTGLQLKGRVSDGAVLRNQGMQWGDRCPVFICDRSDNLETRFYQQVCFTYLKTTSHHPPARLDLPRWIYEAGEQERIINLVRAECVVGAGYPYALETADAVAVLTMQDRERFYRLFQQFTEGEGLELRFSRKSISKRGRR